MDHLEPKTSSASRRLGRLASALFLAALICTGSVTLWRSTASTEPAPLLETLYELDRLTRVGRAEAMRSGAPVRIEYRVMDSRIELTQAGAVGGASGRRVLEHVDLPVEVLPGAPGDQTAIRLGQCGDGCFVWTITSTGERPHGIGHVGLTDGQRFVRLVLDDRASGLERWVEREWQPLR